MRTDTVMLPGQRSTKEYRVIALGVLLCVAWALMVPSTVSALPGSRVYVWPDSDRIVGAGWTPGTAITIQIDNPATVDNPDYTMALTSGLTGYFESMFPAFDIKRGYTVTVLGLPTARTLVVHDLTVMRVDPTTDYIRGLAHPLSRVDVYAELSGSNAFALTAPSGIWDLVFPVDLSTLSYGFVWQKDADGDETRVDWPCMASVYRFYNRRTGVHFYTADTTEKNNVAKNLASTYNYEGVGYLLNTTSKHNGDPLYRFYNKKKGVHFYTASEAEKNNVVANLSSIYKLEGMAYSISNTAIGGSKPVYRFYNKKKGVHFYTADASERQNVIDRLSGTYKYEGIGYYLAP